MDRFVVISGCSSGGKSTLIAELSKGGYAVVEEPGRRIVKEELALGGSALPWINPIAFARRGRNDPRRPRGAGSLDGWVFFDRGVIDAAAALEQLVVEEQRLGAVAVDHQDAVSPAEAISVIFATVLSAIGYGDVVFSTALGWLW